MQAIQTLGLTRHFGKLVAVKGVDLEIGQHELFSLLGPNGAGKTTTINMLCCLLKPTRGTAQIMGYDINQEAFEVKKLIGVSPQETAISERLNCLENLALVGRIHSLSTAQIRKHSRELVELMGLTGREKDRVGTFSGGLKRRLSIAMALIHDPPIIFLDEPTLGLDPQARRVMWQHIAQLKKGKTILLTTHYMEEADNLSDEIAIIDEGKIVTSGTPTQLKNSLKSATSALLVEGKNITHEVIINLKSKYSEVKEIDGGLRISHRDLDFKELTEYLYSLDVTISSATLEQPSLEDVFLQITGKEYRD
ncbi:ABC transporter ATP-binding protein [Chloroflexota bacterium]